MQLIHQLMAILGLAGLWFAAGYAVLSVFAVLVWTRPRATLRQAPAAVTLLKPLCGAEPGLYEHLRTFCRQDYDQYQIVFGVRDSGDPACAVVERLMREFPSLRIDLVVNPQLHGSNFKVSNLINMMALARHDVLVMADSDASVGTDYLTSVTASLSMPNVGLVTCVYHGVPTEKIWSRLGAMYINEWYVPSVLLAWMFGYQGYVSGQTVCLTRATLTAIGGLRAVVNDLADDYRLGELVRRLGLDVVLSSYLVEGEHHEPRWASLTSHETRWMSTIRVVRPRSFRGVFLTFSLPLAGAGLLLISAAAPAPRAAYALFWTTVTARLALHLLHRLRSRRPILSDLWLLPARDLLLCWVWWRSFFTSRVIWRGGEFDIRTDGVMRHLS